jgi:hypothetical protein
MLGVARAVDLRRSGFVGSWSGVRISPSAPRTWGWTGTSAWGRVGRLKGPGRQFGSSGRLIKRPDRVVGVVRSPVLAPQLPGDAARPSER